MPFGQAGLPRTKSISGPLTGERQWRDWFLERCFELSLSCSSKHRAYFNKYFHFFHKL